MNETRLVTSEPLCHLLLRICARLYISVVVIILLLVRDSLELQELVHPPRSIEAAL